MSTSLPEHITRPEFAVAVRGYDRAQVDDYLGRVLEWLADAEGRAATAEETSQALTREVSELRRTVAQLEERVGLPPPQSMSAFTERLSEVMQSAMAAAESLRADADLEAHDRRNASVAECERMIGEASDEAERILADARSEERTIIARIVDLGLRRAAAVEELRRIHEHLGAVVAEVGTETGRPAGPQVERVATGPEDTAVVEALAGTAVEQTGQTTGGGAPADATAGDASAGETGTGAGMPGPATPTMVQPTVANGMR